MLLLKPAIHTQRHPHTHVCSFLSLPPRLPHVVSLGWCSLGSALLPLFSAPCLQFSRSLWNRKREPASPVRERQAGKPWGGRPSGNGRGEGRPRSIADCRIRLFSESIMLMKILTCDCTNLMGQNHSNTVSEKQRTSAIESNDKVSYETIITWQQSFDNLMNHKQGQKIFAEFLKGEYSDENILFWQACEELKREKNAEKIEEKARIIYEDFISILSPKEVSLDSRVRETVNNNMQKPSANTFDDAQSQIYTLMQRDSYPRFLASPIYKNLVGGGTVEDL